MGEKTRDSGTVSDKRLHHPPNATHGTFVLRTLYWYQVSDRALSREARLEGKFRRPSAAHTSPLPCDSHAVAMRCVQVARKMRSSMPSPRSNQAAHTIQYIAIITFHATNHPCERNLLVPARKPCARVPPNSNRVPSMSRPAAEVPASTFAVDCRMGWGRGDNRGRQIKYQWLSESPPAMAAMGRGGESSDPKYSCSICATSTTNSNTRSKQV